MKKLLLITLILALLLAFGYGLIDARITGIENIQGDTVTFNGDLTIANPSWIALSVTGGEYTVTMDGEPFGNGTVEAFTLDARSETTTTFTYDADLSDTATTIITFLGRDNVTATIQGSVTVSVLGISYTTSFEQHDQVEDILEHLVEESGILPDTPSI